MDKNSNASSSTQDEMVIILKITEAIGLNISETVWLQASINGNKLDCEPIKTGHTTTFDCCLVWETDKKSIKQLRIENLPLKIDVYGIKNYSGNINDAAKEFIGYILLPVRGIPMLPVQKALKVKCRWTKLIGLPKEWRPYKPELLMSVLITSKEFLAMDTTNSQEIQSIKVRDSIVIEENPTPSTMLHQKGIFVRLIQKEGVLQVGNMDSDCDIFNIRLLIENIKFLDNAITEQTENVSNRDFFINYILLGNNHSKQLERKFNRTHQIQEKISINFRSSLAVLKEYFENVFYIPIEVYMNDKMIGTTEIRFNNILENLDIHEYLNKYPKGQRHTDMIEIKTPVTIEFSNKPMLEYKILILHQGTKIFHPKDNYNDAMMALTVDEKAGGDYIPVIAESEKEKSCEIIIEELGNSSNIKIESAGVEYHRAVSEEEENRFDTNVIPKKNEKVSEIPRLFSYNLLLKSIKFNKKPYCGIYQVSLFHEMADTPRIFANQDIHETDIEGNSIKFNGIELKLYFTSNANNIMDLVRSSQACTLCIRGPYNTHAKAYLDCRHMIINNKEKTTGNILLKNQNETVTALAEIIVFLDDAGIIFNANRVQTNYEEFEYNSDDKNATRTIEAQKELLFDENLAHGMIEELEEWKEQQKKIFLVELKENEIKYLDKLKQEFDAMKALYEDKFIEKNNELNDLTKSLENAHDAIKKENTQHIRNEEYIRKIKLELEQYYTDKLLALKERTKHLEEDFTNELNLKNLKIGELECNNKHLHEKVEFLTHENCDLRESYECLNKKYESLKVNLVPKEELENLVHELRLLQEKFELAHQSKSFYKQQWAKSFRECHKIRRECIDERKDGLFSSKCDRLCDMLSDESSLLNFEKEELEEIKHCLSLDDDLHNAF